MEVRINLTGFLKDYQPKNGKLKIKSKSTVDIVLDELKINHLVNLVLVNEVVASRSCKLKHNDRITVVGIIGGG